MKDKVDELEQATTANGLIKNLKKAWSNISGDVLQNIVSSMPRRGNSPRHTRYSVIEK